MKIDFECVTCGQCCRQEGYVFIDPDETRSLAALMEITEKEFLDRYTKKFQGSRRVRGPYQEPCIFLKEEKCSVYGARPSQCRTFPFWGENFKYSGRLKEISSYCRGIRKTSEV